MRWVELLDDETPFSLSVHSKISPLTAIAEAEEVLEQFSENSYFLWMHLVDSIRRAYKIIATDRLLDKPSFTRIRTLQHELNFFVQLCDSVEHESRFSAIEPRLPDLVAKVREIHQLLDASYVEESITDLTRRAYSQYTRPTELQKLDDAVSRVAVEVVRKGRALRECCEYVLDKCQHATAENGTDRVLNALNELIRQPRRSFQVAVVFDQVSNLSYSGLPREYQFGPLKPGHIHWNKKSPCSSDQKLEYFCNHHWYRGGTPNSARKVSRESVIKVVSVEAWDREDARNTGLRIAESLVDLMNAGSRTRSIGLKRKVLVRDISTDTVHDLKGVGDIADEARPLRLKRPAALARSLRFASRANNERSWTMAVLFYWISFENLFSADSGATRRVQQIVPMAVSRTALRDAVTYPRRLVAHFSSSWEDHPSWESIFSTCDMDDALDQDGVQYPDVLKAMTSSEFDSAIMDNETVPLYVEYRLNFFRRRVTNRDMMTRWCTEMADAASWALQRAVYLRNRTVHEAINESDAERSLAIACREISDAVFEVCAFWLNRGERTPFEAMKKFESLFLDLRSDWQSKSTEDVLLDTVIYGGRRPQSDLTAKGTE